MIEYEVYIVMYHSGDAYDGWWHPACAFHLRDDAEEFIREARSRAPGLSEKGDRPRLSIEKVPLNKRLVQTDAGPPGNPQGSRLYRVAFSFDDDGRWDIDYANDLDGEEVSDMACEPPVDLHDVLGEETLLKPDSEKVHVIAKDRKDAIATARPLIEMYVEGATGIEPVEEVEHDG